MCSSDLVASVLVHRFREREETVRCDVFSAYKSLLRITRPAVQSLEEAKRTGLAPDEGAVAAVRALEGQIQQLVRWLAPERLEHGPSGGLGRSSQIFQAQGKTLAKQPKVETFPMIKVSKSQNRETNFQIFGDLGDHNLLL